MERVEYVGKNKPRNEVEVRLHNMIYLGGCAAMNKFKLLTDDYYKKIRPLDDKILAYIRKHIPDCPWDGRTLFPK